MRGAAVLLDETHHLAEHLLFPLNGSTAAEKIIKADQNSNNMV